MTWQQSNGPVLWFVVHPGKQPSPSLQTVSYTRNGAIRHWLKATKATGDKRNWRYWYRQGLRARRVKIRWQVQP
jgi:hypothetical protein